MEKRKKFLVPIFTFLLGLASAGMIASYRGAFQADSVTEVMSAITDGFFIVGILLACFGVLVLVSAGGAFDMLGYSIGLLTALFSKEKRKDPDFYSYMERKKAERQDRKSVSFLFWIGGIFLLVSVILLVVFRLY